MPLLNTASALPAIKPRVVVGMSGGVDSSVAALLLLEQGYEVHGVFMKNWEESFAPGYCSVAEDLEDASDVCDTLGVPLHKVNFVQEYQDRVFAIFLEEFRRGRTPNPDILCNKEIKFKAFLDHAHKLGADYIATGHYARLDTVDGRRRLLKGLDANKDQSYFLHALSQFQIEHALFPVGELLKPDVRKLAEANDLITFNKKDSTGICFIGERRFSEFLSDYLPAQPGPMRTPEGETVGEHHGLMYYTLGQRQGLGIGGRRGDSGEPWFTLDKSLEDNVLIVGQGTEHPRLMHGSLSASQLNWIAGSPPSAPFVCKAKVRYRQQDQLCTIAQMSEDGCTVNFNLPQRAITPGQSVVFYQDDECLGGGVIDTVLD